MRLHDNQADGRHVLKGEDAKVLQEKCLMAMNVQRSVSDVRMFVLDKSATRYSTEDIGRLRDDFAGDPPTHRAGCLSSVVGVEESILIGDSQEVLFQPAENA